MNDTRARQTVIYAVTLITAVYKYTSFSSTISSFTTHNVKHTALTENMLHPFIYGSATEAGWSKSSIISAQIQISLLLSRARALSTVRARTLHLAEGYLIKTCKQAVKKYTLCFYFFRSSHLLIDVISVIDAIFESHARYWQLLWILTYCLCIITMTAHYFKIKAN